MMSNLIRLGNLLAIMVAGSVLVSCASFKDGDQGAAPTDAMKRVSLTFGGEFGTLKDLNEYFGNQIGPENVKCHSHTAQGDVECGKLQVQDSVTVSGAIFELSPKKYVDLAKVFDNLGPETTLTLSGSIIVAGCASGCAMYNRCPGVWSCRTPLPYCRLCTTAPLPKDR
jgi:hypothetical protein